MIDLNEFEIIYKNKILKSSEDLQKEDKKVEIEKKKNLEQPIKPEANLEEAGSSIRQLDETLSSTINEKKLEYNYLNNSIKTNLIDLVSKLNILENKLFKITLINHENCTIPIVVGRGGKNYLIDKQPDLPTSIFMNFPEPPLPNAISFPSNLLNEILSNLKDSKGWKVYKFSKKGNPQYSGMVMIKKSEWDVKPYFICNDIFSRLIQKAAQSPVIPYPGPSFAQHESLIDVNYPFSNPIYTVIDPKQDLPKTVQTQLRGQIIGVPRYYHQYSPFKPLYSPPEEIEDRVNLGRIIGSVSHQLGLNYVAPPLGTNLGDFAYEVAFQVKMFPYIKVTTEIDKSYISSSLASRFGGRSEDYNNISGYISHLGYLIPFMQAGGVGESLINIYTAAFPESISFLLGSIIGSYKRDPTMTEKEIQGIYGATKKFISEFKYSGLFPAEFGAAFNLGVKYGYLGRFTNEEEYKQRLKDYFTVFMAARHLVRDVYLIRDGDIVKYLRMIDAFKDVYPFQEGEELAKSILYHAYFHKFGGLDTALLSRIGDKLMPGEVSRDTFRKHFTVLLNNARSSNIGNIYGAILRLKADGFIERGTEAYDLAESILEGNPRYIYPAQIYQVLLRSGVDITAINTYIMNREMNAKALPIQAIPSVLQGYYRDFMNRANIILSNPYIGRGLPQEKRQLIVRQILDMQAQRLGYSNFLEIERLMGPSSIEAMRELFGEAENYSRTVLESAPNTNVFDGVAGVVRAIMEKRPFTEVIARYFGVIHKSLLPEVEIKPVPTKSNILRSIGSLTKPAPVGSL